MLVNIASLDKSCVLRYLLTCTSLLYMKGELIIVPYIIVQIMELLNFKGPRQHYIALDQVLEICKGHPFSEALLYTKGTIML